MPSRNTIIYVAIAAIVSVSAGIAWHNWRMHIQQLALDRQATELSDQVGSQMDISIAALDGAAAFLQANGSLTEADWENYYDKSGLKELPGLRAIGYDIPVTADNQLAVEHQYGVQVHPATNGPHQVIVLDSPLSGNSASLGLDLGGINYDYPVILKARDTGLPASSGLLHFITQKYSGFIIAIPVYRQDMPVSTVAQRRAAFIGSVGTAYVPAEMISSRLIKNEHVSIFSSADTSAPNLLFAGGAQLAHPAFTSKAAITLPDSTWTVVAQAADNELVPLWVQIGLLFLFLLWIGWLFSSIRRQIESDNVPRWFGGYTMAQKFWGLLGIVCLSLLLIFSMFLAGTEALNGARAYTKAESLWSKAQKEAILELRRYTRDRNEQHYQNFLTDMAVYRGDRQARLEMDKQNSNYGVVAEGFLAGQNSDSDVWDMYQLYKNVRWQSDFQNSVADWQAGDAAMQELEAAGASLHQAMTNQQIGQQSLYADLSKIDILDGQLSGYESAFSRSMSQAATWLRNLLILVASVLTVLLLIVLAFLVWMLGAYIRRSMRQFDEVAMNAVTAGDFTKRMRIATYDEIGHLAGSLNNMLASLEDRDKALKNSLARTQSDTKLLEDTKVAMLNILEDLSTEKETVENEKIKDEILLNSIGEGLVVTDEYANIINVNDAACNTMGYKKEEIIGEWFPQLFAIYDKDGKPLDTMTRPIAVALGSGKTVNGQYFYKRKHGGLFPAYINVSPFLIDGRPAGAIEVFRDVTVEYELERSKDEFVSLASHQLRTPASGVKAFLSMLLDGYAGKISSKQREFVGKAFDSNERQLRIVDDMLNVARVDSGRLGIAPAPTDIVPLFKRIVEEQQAVAALRGQQLALSLPRGKQVAEIDPEKMGMVIDNLVSNALKYTKDHGKVEVSVKPVTDTLEFSVSDNGVGINRGDFRKLYKKFSRIDNELSALSGGTGLGLYLVKAIVELHKGTIKVESQPGKGTTFVVSVPAKTAKPSEADVTAGEAEPRLEKKTGKVKSTSIKFSKRGRS